MGSQIRAIDGSINQKPKYVLDDDIAKCFPCVRLARARRPISFMTPPGSSRPTLRDAIILAVILLIVAR